MAIPEDDPIVPASQSDDPVFDIGDQTIYAMRSQTWAFSDGDDYGTMVVHPSVPIQIATEIDDENPIDDKIDAVLRTLDNLQRRIDSIETLLARLLLK